MPGIRLVLSFLLSLLAHKEMAGRDRKHASVMGPRGIQAQHPRVREGSSGTQALVPSGLSANEPHNG